MDAMTDRKVTRGATGRGHAVLTAVVFLVLVAATGSSGALFMPGEWYAGLRKPEWTPPSWLFGPAWTVLYVAIAAAGWLVWRARRRLDLPLMLWGLQLIANAAWSWLFFGIHRPGLAFIDIIIMLSLIVGFIDVARQSSPVAAWLFVPYALWVTFAGALNLAIWLMN